MKKIKELSKDEMYLFSEPFMQSPTPTLVRNDQAVRVLTSSEEFGQRVILVECVSGSTVVKCGIKRGIIVYRYDSKDESVGTPINVDLYVLNNSTLFKVCPPFPGHRLAFLPE